MGPSDWDRAVADYLRDGARRGLRPATLRYYELALGRLGTAAALSAPDELTLACVRAFADAPGGLAPVSLRGYLRATKTFSRWLLDEGQIGADLAAAGQADAEGSEQADRRLPRSPSAQGGRDPADPSRGCGQKPCDWIQSTLSCIRCGRWSRPAGRPGTA